MSTAIPKRRGFSLVEALIVVAVMSILAGVVMTHFEPSNHDQLMSAANLLVADLSYARTLAVTNDTTYEITFSLPENRYVLEHTGGSAVFDNLPESPFRPPTDSSKQQTTDLDELPQLGAQVELIAVYRKASVYSSATTVEFNGLGSTTTTATTEIWLGCGSGANRRYLSVEVEPTTGLATLGDFQADAPSQNPSVSEIGEG